VRAVILAAGAGERMGSRLPKSLLKVGKESILERQIRLLERHDVDISIVVGYRAPAIMQTVLGRASYVFNTQYLETGSLYSLSLAAKLFPSEESMIVTYADMFVDDIVIRCVLDRPDSVSMVKPYDGRGTRLYFEDDVVVGASAATDPDPDSLSFGGIAHLSRAALGRIVSIPGFEGLSATFGFSGCRAIVTRGQAINVNTPEDLEYTRENALHLNWHLPVMAEGMENVSRAAFKDYRGHNPFRPFVDIIERLGDISGQKFLDVGCGVGYYGELLSVLGSKVRYTGLDFAEPMISRARELWPTRTFILGDMTDFDYSGYDIVLASGIINELPDWTAGADVLNTVEGTLILHRIYIRDGPTRRLAAGGYGIFQTYTHLFNEEELLGRLSNFRVVRRITWEDHTTYVLQRI